LLRWTTVATESDRTSRPSGAGDVGNLPGRDGATHTAVCP